MLSPLRDRKIRPGTQHMHSDDIRPSTQHMHSTMIIYSPKVKDSEEISLITGVDHNINGLELFMNGFSPKNPKQPSSSSSSSSSFSLQYLRVIHRDVITEFWKNALINKLGADGAGTVELMVKGTQVTIFEQVIREVLEFGDASAFPIEYSADQVKEVLEKMCYEGTYPPTIKKLLPPYWRKFVEVEDTHAVSSINFEVAEEHVAPKPKFQFAFEEIENLSELQGSLPKQFLLILNNPSESYLEDSAHTLLPRKRKRRDPRPGVLITDSVQKTSTPIEPDSMAQNIQGPFTEFSPVIQEMSSPIPEPTSMDQDFQSPIVEEEVLPLEGAQASGSSFETPCAGHFQRQKQVA
uniref:Uncharacterized protein n=1 Tax=Lactuca sativa TaxID=4236 RepID=A0A9R1XCB0_LACSA|nr:hypothetical protein LSAT_V11C400186260 [Lactuca sativa]